MTASGTDAEQCYYDRSGFARLAEAEDWFFWFIARNRLICWALGKYFPRLGSYCEVGFGTGATLQAIARAFPNARLIGIDYYTEGEAWARTRVPHACLVRGDILSLPAVARNCDVLAVFDVLEHIPEDKNALLQLYLALRPGGGLIVTVPQHPQLWSVSDEIGHHQRRYTRSELVACVRAAGFDVIFVTSFVSFLLPILWLNRKRASAPVDAYAELKIGTIPNTIFGVIMTLERWLIKAGVTFPAGGSLLLLARRN